MANFEIDRNVIEKNLFDNTLELSDCLEKRISHIYDLANLLKKEMPDNTNVLEFLLNTNNLDYLSNHGFDISSKTNISQSVIGEILNCNSTDFDRINLCSFLTEEAACSFDELSKLLFGTEDTVFDRHRVGMLHNQQFDDAFVNIAAKLHGLESNNEDNFKEMLESVNNGKNEYALVPVRNSVDGRLDSLYNLIFKNSLIIKMLSKVYSDGGEYTYFALVGKGGYKSFGEDDVYFEFNVSFDDLFGMNSIITAINFYKGKIENVMTILDSSSDNNAFSFVVNVTNANVKSLIAYLAIFFPRFIPVGLYHVVE